ncbi:hypothetical protein FA95DRAFT_335873 [Auriscalpium vulgare]|uniref:Uncharacterized protein n=1 Tax=Auriscalpium vulgare TaxID=40419 RepID=A0ACB8RIX7_9AGAM|nr:hypothetical protein FA95DRAFT_335873 [Auriscalpium vulgare]
MGGRQRNVAKRTSLDKNTGDVYSRTMPLFDAPMEATYRQYRFVKPFSGISTLRVPERAPVSLCRWRYQGVAQLFIDGFSRSLVRAPHRPGYHLKTMTLFARPAQDQCSSALFVEIGGDGGCICSGRTVYGKQSGFHIDGARLALGWKHRW